MQIVQPGSDDMPDDTEQTIRDRAYELWERAGKPEGQDKEFWTLAERQLAEDAGIDLSAETAEIHRPPLVAGLPVH